MLAQMLSVLNSDSASIVKKGWKVVTLDHVEPSVLLRTVMAGDKLLTPCSVPLPVVGRSTTK
jgi:hypothetical protein